YFQSFFLHGLAEKRGQEYQVERPEVFISSLLFPNGLISSLLFLLTGALHDADSLISFRVIMWRFQCQFGRIGLAFVKKIDFCQATIVICRKQICTSIKISLCNVAYGDSVYPKDTPFILFVSNKSNFLKIAGNIPDRRLVVSIPDAIN